MPFSLNPSKCLVVFGIDLQALIIRESQGDPQRGAVPSVIEQCINEVEERGLSEVGICKYSSCLKQTPSINFHSRPHRWRYFGDQFFERSL